MDVDIYNDSGGVRPICRISGEQQLKNRDVYKVIDLPKRWKVIKNC